MEFIGKLQGCTKDIVNNKYLVTFSTNELPNVDGLSNEVLKIVAKKNRHKRSVDANSYCWLIISKIADIVRSSKEEIYEQMLVKYGQPFIENGQVQMISVLETVDIHNFGIYAKLAGTGHVDGKAFNHYIVFRGSSTYDTREMSIFIDGIVSEAKELGIDTVPRVDLEKIKEKWGI